MLRNKQSSSYCEVSFRFGKPINRINAEKKRKTLIYRSDFLLSFFFVIMFRQGVGMHIVMQLACLDEVEKQLYVRKISGVCKSFFFVIDSENCLKKKEVTDFNYVRLPLLKG